MDRVSRLAGDVVSFNTICSATSERQSSADEVSRIVDLMIVIGGKHSSNTKKLYEICSENCSNTLLIENAKELTDDVIIDSRLKRIGVTAGASTPDWVIEEVINKLKSDNK